MKANEFVKKFGWDLCNSVVEMSINHKNSMYWGMITDTEGGFVYKNMLGDGDNFVLIVDLKRLVESHELVELLGGLDDAKAIVVNKPKGATRYHRGYYLKEARYIYEYSVHLKVWMQNGRHKEWSAMWNSSNSISEIKKAIADVESCQ